MATDEATCGTCGRSFPDIYPSARCPFEASHTEEDPRYWIMEAESDLQLSGDHPDLFEGELTWGIVDEEAGGVILWGAHEHIVRACNLLQAAAN